ncbi:MAG: PqqD family protein [Bacteroidales bacterium]|nr:PqqD family protein [Bacteroidales bacterium]
MKIKKGFILRTICGQSVVSGEGLEQVNFSKLVSLNDTAAWLWSEVEGKDFDASTLTALLLDKYDVSEEVASKDAAALVDKWNSMGLLEA